MTDRERLIEIIGKPINILDSDDLFGAIADHLLKNGVIVPPCKVGDKVYVITEKLPCFACYCCTDSCHLFCQNDDKSEIVVKEATVCGVSYSDVANEIKVKFDETNDTQEYELEYTFAQIGKTVFLTREEAEKALAEKQEGVNND